MKIAISFDGGQKVSATFPDGLSMLTDQPPADGTPGEAPSPFAYFLGAMGTCAGIYVLEFCNARNIPTEQVSLMQEISFEEDSHGKRRVSMVTITIQVPPDFPERYHKAIVRAAELCSVKKAIMNPPDFMINCVVR